MVVTSGTAGTASRSDHQHAYGPSNRIPDSAIPNTITRDTEVENFAKVGNSTTMPITKLGDNSITAVKAKNDAGELG